MTDLGLLGIDLLLWDYALVVKSRVAVEIDLHVVELRLIFCELAFGLLQHDLVGTRVDFNERIAFVDKLALGKVHFDDLAIYAATDRDRVIGGRRSRGQ